MTERDPKPSTPAGPPPAGTGQTGASPGGAAGGPAGSTGSATNVTRGQDPAGGTGRADPGKPGPL